MVSRMLGDERDWPQFDQVFRRERRVTKHGKFTTEVYAGITRLPPEVLDAEQALPIACMEWGLGKGVHYRRDVTRGCLPPPARRWPAGAGRLQ